MKAEEFKKYAGKHTKGKKGNDNLSGGKIIGYDPKDVHHLQLLAIDDIHGDGAKMFEVSEVRIPDKMDLKDWLCGKHKYLWVTIENVIMDEPKELDLTKVLKGCEGVTLWSDAFGECKLEEICTSNRYPIILRAPRKDNYNNQEVFTKEGYFYDCFPNAKCLLWPSETNRDWSTFTKPIKLAEGTPVMCFSGISNQWSLSKYNNAVPVHYKFIVIASEFDFNDFDSNKNKSIV